MAPPEASPETAVMASLATKPLRLTVSDESTFVNAPPVALPPALMARLPRNCTAVIVVRLPLVLTVPGRVAIAPPLAGATLPVAPRASLPENVPSFTTSRLAPKLPIAPPWAAVEPVAVLPVKVQRVRLARASVTLAIAPPKA